MNLQKTNSPRQFPKEWEFKQSVINAESYLESCDSGLPYQPVHSEALAPFLINRFVDDLISRYCPTNKVLDLYGVLYVKMRNEWYDYYEPKDVEQGVPAIPKIPSER